MIFTPIGPAPHCRQCVRGPWQEEVMEMSDPDEIHTRPLVRHMHVWKLSRWQLQRQIEFLDSAQSSKTLFVEYLFVPTLTDCCN